jgi:hypothetical protein
MSHQKRTSEVIDEAHKQLAEVQLGPLAHLGNRLAIAACAAQIVEASKALHKHNQALDKVEASRIELEASEAKLEEMDKQILAAVAAKYGVDSYEYEVVSGKRKIGNKRPRKNKTKSVRQAAG